MSINITVQTDTTEEAVVVLAELERLRIRVRSYATEPTDRGLRLVRNHSEESA